MTAPAYMGPVEGWGGTATTRKKGVAVDRRNVSAYEPRELGWAANAASALSSTDGRWAVVSTSVTAMIAGSIAWLAAGTMPPATSHGFEAGRNPSLLPYELFMRLSARERAAQASIASFGPIMPVKSHPSSLSLSLDNASSDELTGDTSDSNRGVDTRTITMDRGDTLATSLVDAGVPMNDAKAVVNALAKVYSPKMLRGGQAFKVTFATGAAQKSAAPVAQITYAPPNGADAETDDVPNPAAEAPVGRLLFDQLFADSGTGHHGLPCGRRRLHGEERTTAAREETAPRGRQDRFQPLSRRDAGWHSRRRRRADDPHVLVKVDFQRDLRPGDSFEFYYNYYYTPDGRAAKQGDIAYAAMHLAGRTVQLYRYEPHDGGGADYFNSKGQSAKAC